MVCGGRVCMEINILHLYLFIASSSIINYCAYAPNKTHVTVVAMVMAFTAHCVFVSKWIKWCVATLFGSAVNFTKLQYRLPFILHRHISHAYCTVAVVVIVGGHHASTIINKCGSRFISMHEYFMWAACRLYVACGYVCRSVVRNRDWIGCRDRNGKRQSDKCRQYLWNAKRPTSRKWYNNNSSAVHLFYCVFRKMLLRNYENTCQSPSRGRKIISSHRTISRAHYIDSWIVWMKMNMKNQSILLFIHLCESVAWTMWGPHVFACSIYLSISFHNSLDEPTTLHI